MDFIIWMAKELIRDPLTWMTAVLLAGVYVWYRIDKAAEQEENKNQ